MKIETENKEELPDIFNEEMESDNDDREHRLKSQELAKEHWMMSMTRGLGAGVV